MLLKLMVALVVLVTINTGIAIGQHVTLKRSVTEQKVLGTKLRMINHSIAIQNENNITHYATVDQTHCTIQEYIEHLVKEKHCSCSDTCKETKKAADPEK